MILEFYVKDLYFPRPVVPNDRVVIDQVFHGDEDAVDEQRMPLRDTEIGRRNLIGEGALAHDHRRCAAATPSRN